MSQFIIEGGRSLKGSVSASGSKNAALPIIAATILLEGQSTIHNIPDIADIRLLLEILEGLGSKYSYSENTLKIDSSTLQSTSPDIKKVRHLRGSLLLMGPLLAKYSNADMAYPGGCYIGHRTIEPHLHALRALGAEIKEENELIHLSATLLTGTIIILPEISVTATENAILAAVTASGTTEIHLAACEPHVQDLVNFLNKAGAKIKGNGSNTLIIDGVQSLKAVEYEVISDAIEGITYAIAALATNSEIVIEKLDTSHLDIILLKLREAGARFTVESDRLIVRKGTSLKATNILTLPYPGFPTDLQAPWAVLMTQGAGSSLIHDPLFEGRLNYVRELAKMGADGTILDPHRAIINGPTPLFGSRITSLDLRAGATLIVAALLAEGVSTIEKAEIIDRGYEKIDEKLRLLGAKIERKD